MKSVLNTAVSVMDNGFHKKYFVTLLLMLVTGFSAAVFAQTTISFDALAATNGSLGNPYNHTESSEIWTFTVSGTSPDIRSYSGFGSINVETSGTPAVNQARTSIVRNDGADFNFKSVRLEASLMDQHIRIYGKNNGSVIYGPQAYSLETGSLVATFSPSNWNSVDEIEIVIYQGDADNGSGYENDLFLDIDNFQYTMNQAPSISNLNGDSGTFTEDGPALVLDSGTAASVTDPDASGYNGGNVTAAVAGAASGEDLSINTSGAVSLSAGMTAGSTVSVSGTSIGTIAGGGTGQDGANLVVTLNSNATDARIGTLLQNITYANDSQSPSGSRTAGVTVTDAAGGTSAAASITVNLSGVNDDPAITGLPTDITVTEDAAGNVDLSAATFSDVDAGANSITLAIAAGAGTLSASSGGGVTTSGSGTGTLTLTGYVSDIDIYLNTAANIQYTGTLNTNGNDVTTLTLTANDGGYTGTGGGGNVTLGTVNVDITAVNDPPVVTGVFGTGSEVVAGVGAQNITGLDNAGVSNVDSPDYNGGFVIITQGSGTTNGSFGVDGTTATSGGDGTIAAGETIAAGGTAVGTVHPTNDGQGGNALRIDFNSANATSARIQTLVRSLTYSAPSSLGARMFTLTLNDADGTAGGGDEDASGSFTITVTPNPPVIGNLNGDNPSIPVGGPAGNIDSGTNATVTDADSPNFNGGNLAVTQNTGTANGSFSVDGSGATGVSSGITLGTADGHIVGSEIIYVDGVAIASVSSSSNGQSGNNLILNFGSNATPARVQTVLRSLRYAAGSGGGDRTFTVSIRDAGSSYATGTANITITMPAPEMGLNRGTTAIADGGSYNYGNRAVSSNTDVTFTIHNTGTGVLSVTTPVTPGGADAGQFSVQQQPLSSVAALDSTTLIIRFTPTTSGAKTATVAIVNNDDNENPYNLTLNGSGNTPPAGGNDAVTISEDQTFYFTPSDFTFNDPDGDGFAGIRLQSLETAGTLRYNGVDAVTLVDYPDVTRLSFVPEANATGSPYAVYTFQVIDDKGGYSVAGYTMTIHVTPANDPPAISAIPDQFTQEDYSTNWIPFTVDDEETDPALLTVRGISMNQSLVTDERIVFSGTGTDRRVKIRPLPDQSGTAEIRIYVSDGHAERNTHFNLTVDSVNDPPVITGLPMVVFDEDSTAEMDLDTLVQDMDNQRSELMWSVRVLNGFPHLVTSGGQNTAAESPLSVIIDDTSHIALFSARPDYFGSHQVIFTVTDPGGGKCEDTCQVTINPVNDPPRITVDLQPVILAQGTSYSFPRQLLDLIVDDPDNPDSVLVWSIGENAHFNWEVTDDSVTVQPQAGWSGTDTVIVIVSDGELSDSKPLRVTVISRVDETPPGMPQNLTAVPSETVIQLSWDANTDPDMHFYSVYRSLDSTTVTEAHRIARVNHPVHTFNDSTAENDIVYFYSLTATDSSGNESGFSHFAEAMRVPQTLAQGTGTVLTAYSLSRNYPNPFNPVTTIEFGIPVQTHVHISVFDILGRNVRELVDEVKSPGVYQIRLDASGMESGVYFIRMQTSDFSRMRKCIIIK